MGRVRSVFQPSRRRARRSERRYLGTFIVFALILVVVNVAGWRVYARMRATLEAELEQRLVAIAEAAADAIDPEYVVDLSRDATGLSALIVGDRFERLTERLSLANLVLLGPEGTTLLDLRGATPPGEPHPLFALHPEAFAAARSGIATASVLYRSRGERYENGYAPVANEAGATVAVVAVGAGAGFFDALSGIGRIFLIASAASVAAIVLLGLVFVRLVREEMRLETTRRRTEGLSLMGEMAASVAHEIKNPLGIIRATAERLRARHGTGEEIFDYIPEEVDRLDAIVTTYLDFARDAGEERERRANVAVIADSVLSLLSRDLASSGVAVETDTPPDLTAEIQPNALRQALLNLILNARQAMPRGGTLGIRAANRDGQIEIAVSDTGVGIEPGDVEKVFEPFHSGRRHGSGLGLSITRRVVADAGGRIEVSSTRGEGTVFRIRLPLSHEE